MARGSWFPAFTVAAVSLWTARGRWQPVPMEKVRVAIALRKGGATAGVTIRF